MDSEEKPLLPRRPREDSGDFIDERPQTLKDNNNSVDSEITEVDYSHVKFKAPYVEHKYSFKELASVFNTSIDLNDPTLSAGMDPEDAELLLKSDGLNFLTPPEKRPLWLLFFMQFANLFMILLLVASSLCMLTFIVYPSDESNLWLSLFLLVVVTATCYSSYVQEAKSDQLMEKFRDLVPEDAIVIRGGAVLGY